MTNTRTKKIKKTILKGLAAYKMASRCSMKLHIAAFKLRNSLAGQTKYACLTQAPIGTSWRGFCSDSKSKDDNKMDANAKGDHAVRETRADVGSKEAANEKKEAISKQLLQQILSMKISGTINGETKEPLTLARPTWGERRKQMKEMERIEKETPREHPDLDPKMVTAVKEVAANLGGIAEKTETELIQKLRSHNVETEELKHSMTLGNLVAGLKIDRTRTKSAPGIQDRRMQGGFLDDNLDEKGRRLTSFPRHRLAPSKRAESFAILARSDIDLFEAPPLNIFTNKSSANEALKLDFPVLETWDELEKNELRLLVIQPFTNAFEEQIQWTKDGKLWKFPINNEQDLDEEANVGFHEHVFLEPLIEDFPKKGPIRHFIELVIIGLSKNSYLTVQQKKDHIDWFRSYFKDKEAILKEVGALG